MAAVYQSLFGGDVYPSLEEKVANLLFNEIGKSEFTGSVTRKPKRYTGKKIKKRIKSWF